MNRTLIEIASWRLISELHRRHPTRLKLIETHPGGGQYDCLSLFDQSNQPMADFNRVGRLHIWNRFDGQTALPEPFDIWPAMMSAPSPLAVLDRVCSLLGLDIPKHLPPSQPATLVYRFIAAFLSHTSFGIETWECRNGMLDTSGSEGVGVLNALFVPFPGVDGRLAIALPDDVFRQPAYRFWFLLEDGRPRLALETSGTVWNDRGEVYQLADLYADGRQIWPLVCRVAGYLLP